MINKPANIMTERNVINRYEVHYTDNGIPTILKIWADSEEAAKDRSEEMAEGEYKFEMLVRIDRKYYYSTIQ